MKLIRLGILRPIFEPTCNSSSSVAFGLRRDCPSGTAPVFEEQLTKEVTVSKLNRVLGNYFAASYPPNNDTFMVSSGTKTYPSLQNQNPHNISFKTDLHNLSYL